MHHVALGGKQSATVIKIAFIWSFLSKYYYFRNPDVLEVLSREAEDLRYFIWVASVS